MNMKDSTTHTAPSQAHLFAWHPHSAFGKLSIVALLGAAGTSGVLALTIGFPANTALLIVTVSLLVGAGFATLRWRWMPLLLILLSALFLSQFLRAPFVLYHLTDPKGHAFFPFVMDVLLIAFTTLALGASIGAAAQNFRRDEQHASSFRPIALTGLIAGVAGLLLGVILIEGSKLLLVDDVSVLHILANDIWQHGTAIPAHEPGAPTVNNVQVNGNSTQIGPFTTAGTYHLYCTIHQGMNLTIIVQ